MFAEITLNPGGVIAWLAVGLLAGWLAGRVMNGTGYGIIGDLVVGLVGAFIGGFVFGLFVTGNSGFWGSILVAFLGACTHRRGPVRGPRADSNLIRGRRVSDQTGNEGKAEKPRPQPARILRTPERRNSVGVDRGPNAAAMYFEVL